MIRLNNLLALCQSSFKWKLGKETIGANVINIANKITLTFDIVYREDYHLLHFLLFKNYVASYSVCKLIKITLNI